ncbi:MAG: replication initiation protein [Clostridia bacterium]|nr:replication initiation protein [Clostridia bacterium]
MANKIVKDREQIVAKSNDLIRKTRYNLTAQQQKIVLYAVSKIKPNDVISQEYEFSISDLCEACGLKIDEGGYYYKSIKEDLRKLTQREWCIMPDGSEKTMSWIGDADILPLRGTVKITFNKNMEPYLFDLKERYTSYRLQNVLIFKNKYAIRLYEILRSYTTQKLLDSFVEREASFKVDELRQLLQVDFYPRWADFQRFIIKPAVEEINSYSEDIHIEYDTYRGDGRKITTICFIITSPHGMDYFNARANSRTRGF